MHFILDYLRLFSVAMALQVSLAPPLLAFDVQTLSQQRGLVNQMSLATCMVMADLNPKTNSSLALHAADAFDALQKGPVSPAWRTFGPAVRQIASNDLHTVVVQQFLNDSAGLIESLEGDLSNALAQDPRPTAKVTAHIRRLATLSQSMGRDVCLLSMGVNGARAAQQLDGALDAFETVLTDLEEGNEAAGIAPPTDMSLEDQMWMLRGEWDALADMLHGLDGTVNADDVVLLSEMIGQVYTATETTLEMYLSTSARGL